MSHHRALRVGGFVLTAALLASACGSSGDGGPTKKATASTVSTTSTTGTAPGFRYQPMYPFANLAEVARWQRHGASDAAEAWHLHADATALSFARFLGYTEIDRVGSTTGDQQDAHVEVGAANSDGRFTSAATVHLVRYGRGGHVPWEVVGTDDTDFTVTTPGYGAAVTSPMPIGGSITGVDESIRVTIRGLHTEEALGGLCCVAAGGDASPWATTMSFAPPVEGVIVVGASTGGHVRSVERFSVTAANAPTRPKPAP